MKEPAKKAGSLYTPISTLFMFNSPFLFMATIMPVYLKTKFQATICLIFNEKRAANNDKTAGFG
jgi:hypothetical protein